MDDFRLYSGGLGPLFAGNIWVTISGSHDAGWSSPVAREAHNLEVAGSNPVPATLTPA